MLSINSEFVLSPSVLNITGWSLRYHWVPCVLLSWSLIISIWLTVGNWVQLQSQLEPALGGQGRSATTQSSHQWPIRTEPEQAQPIRGRADWSLPCSAWAPVQSRPQHTTQTSSKHWTICLTWLYLMKLLTLNRFYRFYSIWHVSSFSEMPAPLWWNLILPGGCASVLVRAGSGFTSQHGLASELLCLC